MGACGLLLLLWALLVVGSRFLSFTWDEPAHIVGGYLFLARGRGATWYFLSYLHPPLINVAEAALLFLSRPNIPLESLAGWGKHYTAYFPSLVPYLVPVERAEVLTRTPVMLLTMLLGALVFRWGKEVGGARTGLLALGFLTFDPNLLASGRLATTDIGVVTLGTAALYVVWRWIGQPRWRWAIITGGLLGLTLLAKFSGLLWGAACGLLFVGVLVRRWRREGPLRVVQSATAVILASLIVWAAFGFSFGPTSLLPFPLPAPDYWTGLANLMAESAGRLVIAFGKVWPGSQWWFFPSSFLVRNPIPLLVALPVGLWGFIRRGLVRRLLVLSVFPCLYVLASVSGGMSLSYRHMLPVHPFLYLLAAGSGWVWLRRRSRWLVLLCIVLGGWYVVGTLRLFPDELTYANELIGGPEGGYRYLLADTQDWGQAYKELRAYLRHQPGPEPRIVYFTAVGPSFYNISFRPIRPSPGAAEWAAPFHPQPGRYVMGTAPLYGLVGPDPMQLEWFRRARPTAMVGHSLFVYDVADRPEWISQCVTPTLPLDEAAIAGGFGDAALRQVDFDCTSGWVYPGGGPEMGVYAVHHGLLSERGCFSLLPCDPSPNDDFIARHLAGTRLSYEQRTFGLLPAFTLYERGEGSLSVPSSLPVQTAAAGTPPAALTGRAPLNVPVPLDGPLTFLGATAYRTGAGLDVETWWQVAQEPITRPFSIMAHLVTAQGEVLGVADGLSVSPLTLRDGDVVVQRHRFSDPPAGSRVWLRTGAYWLDTMERWTVTETPEADALFAALPDS